MKAKKFIFTKYSLDAAKRTASFSYRLQFQNAQPLTFTEKLVFPKKLALDSIPKELLQKSLQDVHLVLGLSYYKLYCPKQFEVPYAFTKDEAHFWNTVYQKGLGEFLYRNKIPRSQVAKFQGSTVAGKEIPVVLPRKKRALLGIGGGKDSIVAGELLKRSKYDFTALLIETEKTSPISKKVCEVMGAQTLTVKRFLDPKIFQEHEDSYNGHVPISAIFAFIGHLTALLYDYNSVIVGNEQSSNFGNVLYEGQEVNHQWSKSLEFETLFQQHIGTRRTESIRYVSLLRPLYEIRIAEMFSQYPKYFKIFSSCNQSFRVHKKRGSRLWCGECPKCVFVFTLLSAFVSQKELLAIFGQNLYQNEALTPLFRDILGIGRMKPFDCVGTFEEARVAFFLAAKKHSATKVVKALLPQVPAPSEEVAESLFRFHEAPGLPEYLALAVAESILLLGMGKEGMASKQFLERFYPHITITTADQKQDKDYLSAQYDGYDMIIKTPGISPSVMSVPYTTATNIFFSLVDRQKTIGITGTQGKSTTSSLLYQFLKTSGQKAELLGNVGRPMLAALMKPLHRDTLFVLELSSYQLDDLRYSPHTAVILNLYSDHVPYHGTLKKYHEAKAHITSRQTVGDFLVCSSELSKLPLLKNTKATLKIFEAPKKSFVTTLPGTHNQANIAAAAKAASLYNVKPEAINKTLKIFRGLSHRLQNIGTYKGITFYDDAISTTPESTLAALEGLSEVDTVFLGGEDRGYDFRALEKALRQKKVRNVVLFPESGKRILRSQKGLNILETKRMAEAVAFAYKYTTPGKICLLSTASPSYTLWKNFEEKGDIFIEEVKKKGRK